MNSRTVVAVVACLFLVTVLLKKIDEDKKLGTLNNAYLALLFSFYPIIFSPIQGYQSMGTFKARIWAVMTACLIIYEIAFLLFVGKRTIGLNDLFINSSIDIVMILYLAAVTISFFMATDKRTALLGAEGWFTGLLFQYGIVAVYFSVSRFAKLSGGFDALKARVNGRPYMCLVRAILISGSVVFSAGLLHRFLVDPLGIYKFLREEDYSRFLSTIGQATWYSSYLCLVFPVGLHCFIFRDGKMDGCALGVGRMDRCFEGVFVALSAATLVTQNSDTAFAAFFAIFVCYIIFLFVIGEESRDVIVRFGLAIVIMSASILFVGVCEKTFAGRFVALDELSIRIAQGFMPVVGIAVGSLIIASAGLSRHIKRAMAAGLGILIVLIGVIVVLQTSADVYFSFGRNWGNGRGLIWMRTLQMYRDLPIWNKIFGIGPGMFDGKISNYTELILANAHNEWLTALVEYGMIGGILYLGIFMVAITTMIMNIRVNSGGARLEYMIIAAVVAYLVHGIFNYQQCISTPMIFALIGVYSSYKRKAVY